MMLEAGGEKHGQGFGPCVLCFLLLAGMIGAWGNFCSFAVLQIYHEMN